MNGARRSRPQRDAINSQLILRITFIQLIIISLLSSGVFCWKGVEEMLAVLAGGLLGITVVAVSALISLRPLVSGDPRKILVAFYQGLTVKLVATVVLFIVAFEVADRTAWIASPGYLLAGFLVVQLDQLVTPLRAKPHW